LIDEAHQPGKVSPAGGYQSMFDSLDEQMKHDRDRESTMKERMMMWATVAVLSVALFAGLLFGVTKLTG
jgi:hypothetical protein